MTDIIPGERAYSIEPPEPPKSATDIVTPTTTRTGPAVLSPADLQWIAMLDPDALDPADVSTLRRMRNRARREDEARLLDRVLRTDDAARGEADRRAPIEHELKTIENMMNRPVDSAGRRQINQLRAETVVRDTIAEATRECERAYRADPRRMATHITGAPDTVTREEAEREHRQRVAAIEASRETLMVGAQHDVDQEWRQTHQRRLVELAHRKQELLEQLDNPNGNGDQL